MLKAPLRVVLTLTLSTRNINKKLSPMLKEEIKKDADLDLNVKDETDKSDEQADLDKILEPNNEQKDPIESSIELADNQFLINFNPVQLALVMRTVQDEGVFDNWGEKEELKHAYDRFHKKYGKNLIEPLIPGEDIQNVSRLLKNLFFVTLVHGNRDNISDTLKIRNRDIKEIIMENDEDFALANYSKGILGLII